MKKIKKILILILTGVMLFGGMAIGADTDTEKSFTITAVVPSMSELKIHKSETLGTTIGWFNGLTNVSYHDFGSLGVDTDTPGKKESGTYYVSVKTNAKANTYIKAKFDVMEGGYRRG